MKKVHVPNRQQWRRWLRENHLKEPAGIWLVFYKKRTAKISLLYEEAAEEALCFGWIDSIIKRIDEDTYCRKFTPRKLDSKWSKLNRKRVERVIEAGRMTRFGRAKVEAARRTGRWETDARPVIKEEPPKDFVAALTRNKQARQFFEQLAPSYRKHFIAWIAVAKRPETRAKRVRASLALLARGKRLGLK